MSAGTRISVVMCTFNGGLFLREQLDSLLVQTRLPDELVVCDDGSTDDSQHILSDFRSKASFPVRLYFNETNLGSTENFAQSIELCNGNVIVLADQDDVWRPRKLEELEKQFLVHPEIGAVFSDATVVDAELRPLGYALWEHVGFSSVKQSSMMRGHALEVLLKHVVVTGATMGFSRRFKNLLLPIPAGWVHDAWIALLISACTDLGMIHQPLILYRQHAGNQIGARRSGLTKRLKEALTLDRKAYYGGEIARYQAARNRLTEFPQLVRPCALPLLEAKLAHLQFRASLPDNRLLRVPLVLHEFFKLGYCRYSFSWQVAIKDMLVSARSRMKS